MQQKSQNDGWSQANTSPSCLLTLSGLLPKYGTAFAILPQVSMRQMRNINVLLLIRCIQYMLGRDGQSWQRRGPPRVPIVHHGYRLWQVMKSRGATCLLRRMQSCQTMTALHSSQQTSSSAATTIRYPRRGGEMMRTALTVYVTVLIRLLKYCTVTDVLLVRTVQ